MTLAHRITGANEEKYRALQRQRRIATALLLIAMAVFLVTQYLPPSTVVRLFAAAAEAALVGGFADWFAVTALFRHPLGLPIPHTALIRTQKDRIGRSLGNFVRDRFLDPELVIERLRQENRAHQIALWLESEKAGQFAAERVLSLVPVLLKTADDEAVLRSLAALAHAALDRIDFAPLADAAIARVMGTGRHMELVDVAARIAGPALGSFEQTIIEKVGEQTGRFFPKYFDRKIGRAIVRGVKSWLLAIQIPDSEERQAIDQWVRKAVAKFRGSVNYPQLMNEARAAVLSNPAMQQMLSAVWQELKREIASDLQRDLPQIGAVAADVVRTAGRLLRENALLQDYVNTALERLVVDYIAPWREQISDFIAEVVAAWDAQTVSDLIELEVGRDLQFVRINGTVIGALIGMLLFVLSALVRGLG
jgi:uncharacterized membrane-anchored protein YjiN (DUF445 family)